VQSGLAQVKVAWGDGCLVRDHRQPAAPSLGARLRASHMAPGELSSGVAFACAR
jgi:hypothetical protein